jgi:large subunit ribosomal protein L31
MKATIHPHYFEDVLVTCSCGSTFKTGSTKQSITVEVCSKCHPFYTGEQRLMDTRGQIDRFRKKEEAAKEYKAKYGDKKDKKQVKDDKKAKSLRELLGEV